MHVNHDINSSHASQMASTTGLDIDERGWLKERTAWTTAEQMTGDSKANQRRQRTLKKLAQAERPLGTQDARGTTAQNRNNQQISDAQTRQKQGSRRLS
jgi:hypothetical protein